MHNVFESPSRVRAIATLAALVAAAGLAACDKRDPSQTTGQRPDNSTAPRAEQRAKQPDQPTQGAKSPGGDVAQSTERGANEVSNKVKDAAITTAVNSKIAQDPKLSVLRINVDTVNGRVQLRGSAPDAMASQRAEQLASTVDGVVSVDNQLVVSGKG